MTLEKQELDRIEAAKTAIGTAIAGKGVAVPSGIKLDGMAALIDGIEQGSDPVLQSKSVTPSETAQTVKPDSGYDGLSQVSVGAISKTYVGSSVPKQAAQTITPGTADKAIAAGKYLSGTQTIKGDANLVAGNIAKDVTIFGVTGTHEGGEDVSAETAEYTSLLTDLETAIDALPEAGGGGGGGNVETCTVTVNNVNMGMASFAYNSGTGPVYETNVPSNNASTEIIIQKNSVLTIYGVCLMPVVNLSGDIELLGDGNYLGMIKMFTFAITGEGTITIMDD